MSSAIDRRRSNPPIRAACRPTRATRSATGALVQPPQTRRTVSAEIMSDEDLVNALAQYLALEPVEKQALLELPGPIARATR